MLIRVAATSVRRKATIRALSAIGPLTACIAMDPDDPIVTVALEGLACLMADDLQSRVRTWQAEHTCGLAGQSVQPARNWATHIVCMGLDTTECVLLAKAEAASSWHLHCKCAEHPSGCASQRFGRTALPLGKSSDSTAHGPQLKTACYEHVCVLCRISSERTTG